MLLLCVAAAKILRGGRWQIIPSKKMSCHKCSKTIKCCCCVNNFQTKSSFSTSVYTNLLREPLWEAGGFGQALPDATWRSKSTWKIPREVEACHRSSFGERTRIDRYWNLISLLFHFLSTLLLWFISSHWHVDIVYLLWLLINIRLCHKSRPSYCTPCSLTEHPIGFHLIVPSAVYAVIPTQTHSPIGQ